MTRFGVVVLAGGAGRRLGGAAKPTLAVGGAADARAGAGGGRRCRWAGGGRAGLAQLDRAGGCAGGSGGTGGWRSGRGSGRGACGTRRRPRASEPARARPAWRPPSGPAGSAAEAASAERGSVRRPGSGPGRVRLGGRRPAGLGRQRAARPGGTAGLDVVVVLAADLPCSPARPSGGCCRPSVIMTGRCSSMMAGGGSGFVGPGGRRRWSERLAALAATGPLGGRAMRELVAPLRVVGVPVDGGGGRRGTTATPRPIWPTPNGG